jgi:hypothetical protein
MYHVQAYIVLNNTLIEQVSKVWMYDNLGKEK